MPYDLTNFNAELAEVNGTNSFTQTIDAAYGVNEWSVDGYAITAGSNTAVQHGASEALYQLGYRFWTPSKRTRPSTLPASGVRLPRQQFSYAYVQQFFNYGFGGGSTGAQLQADYDLWRQLMCFDDTRRPVGHAWPSIINAIDAQDGFFTNNPTYIIGTPGVGQPSFNLDLTGVDRESLVTRVAHHIAPRLNAQKRHSIDPNDGSTWSSDQVFGFANEVADVVAQTEPDVMLGLYGYAGHRTPVSFQCPRLYVDIARGFNDLGIGYLAMGKRWSQVVPEFGLRCYGDIAAWEGYLRHIPASYLDEFAEHAADGAVGISMETSGNWVKNLIAKQHWARHWRDGATTYQDVLSDAVDKLYEGDSRVADLFTFWAGLGNTSGVFSQIQAAKIVEAMPDTQYRSEFEHYLTIALAHERLHGSLVEKNSGPYFTGLERNLRASKAMEASSSFHHMAYARRVANANTSLNGRPDLSFNANAHWDRFPQAYDQADFLEALALAESSLVQRPDELLDEDLIVVDTQPYPGATQTTPSTAFETQGIATFVFMGPGTVTVDYLSAAKADDVLTFGTGLHQFTISQAAITAWAGGVLFLSMFPSTRMEPVTGNGNDGRHRWAYVPKIVAGKASAKSGSRIRFVSADGNLNVKEAEPPFSSGFDDPRRLPAGIVRVDNVNTRGTHRLTNLNPYVSSTPYKMLMPFDLAKREFPNMIFNGTGQRPDILDLTDGTDGQSDQTED
jgi:hypothetical protein